MMHCYFICGAGSRHTTTPGFQLAIAERGINNVEDQTLIFPSLVVNAASKVTGYLKEAVGEVESLPSGLNVSARGLRYGGLHELQNHYNAGQLGGVFRGGWEKEFVETNNTSSNYSIGNWELCWRAGKGISGYPNAQVPVYPPSLTCLVNCNGYSLINILVKEMYQCHFDIHNSTIQPFAFSMFAAFLRFLPDFERKYGQNHFILQTCKEHFKKCKVSYETILNWSTIVRSDFAAKNIVSTLEQQGSLLANNPEIATVFHDFRTVLLRVEDQNRVQTTENLELRRDFNKLLDAVQFNQQLLRQLQESITYHTTHDFTAVQSTPSRSAKKRSISSPQSAQHSSAIEEEITTSTDPPLLTEETLQPTLETLNTSEF